MNTQKFNTEALLRKWRTPGNDMVSDHYAGILNQMNREVEVEGSVDIEQGLSEVMLNG